MASQQVQWKHLAVSGLLVSLFTQKLWFGIYRKNLLYYLHTFLDITTCFSLSEDINVDLLWNLLPTTFVNTLHTKIYSAYHSLLQQYP